MTRIRLKIPMPRGVCAHVIDRGDHIEIASIVSRIKGEGYGTEAIKRIQKLGRVIRLEAVPYDGWKKSLHRFYKRMGFTATRKGRRTYFEWRPEFMSEWKPIETAPNDELSPFLVLLPGNWVADFVIIQVSRFQSDIYPDSLCSNVDYSDRVLNATHWMPIPKIPNDLHKQP